MPHPWEFKPDPARFAVPCVLFILLVVPRVAAAADLADSRLEIWLGIFRTDQNSQIRVDSKEFGLGTEIDFEK